MYVCCTLLALNVQQQNPHIDHRVINVCGTAFPESKFENNLYDHSDGLIRLHICD